MSASSCMIYPWEALLPKQRKELDQIRDRLRRRSPYVDRICRMIDRKDPRLVPPNAERFRPKSRRTAEDEAEEDVRRRDALATDEEDA